MKQKKFISSVKNSIAGIRYAWSTEKHLRIHFGAFVLLVVVALAIGVNLMEMAVLLLAATLVITAELFNTAVERIVDLNVPGQYHPLARIAKDVAAGAVFFSSISALLLGLLVLLNLMFRKGII